MGKKILFVVQDNHGNMSFNGRPCASDAAVLDRMFSLGKNRPVMTQHVAAGWEKAWKLELKKPSFAPKVFFADLEYPSAYEAEFDELRVICWNRDYPGDQRIHMDYSIWERSGQYSYAGKSHEKITEKIYKRTKTVW